ncbi:MAG: hypothetical protein WBL58_10330 [Peptococcia bacterium]
MWLAILYLLLGLISACLWSQGFVSYLCLSESCQYIANVLQRSWYLWQTVFYLLAATAVMAGWLKKRPKLTYTYLSLGLVTHLVLLHFAWLKTGYLCLISLAFLLAAIIFYVLACRKRYSGSKRWPIAILVVLSILSLVLLVVNPTMPRDTVLKPYSSVAEEAPSPLFTDGKMTVTDIEGNTLELDLRERPIFFWAWWCPYCIEDMVYIKRLPNEEKPYMVITAIKDLPDDIQKSKEKLADAGLEGTTFYVYEKERMVYLPTLFFWDAETNTVRMY